jgi:uncharacterized LabA/DUF88 family protein
MIGIGIGIGLGKSGTSGESMAPIKYRLIDGPFLYRLCSDVAGLAAVDEFQLDLYNLSGGAYRTIYYDALPVRKDNQSAEDFANAEAQKLDFLNRIRAFRAYQVRDGMTRLKTKTSGNRMSQVLEQKGVDTWIAVDAVRLAFTGIADEVEILTADSDLYPAFEAIQMTKARGTLIFEVGRAAPELIYSADFSNSISLNEVISWIGKSSLLSASSQTHRYKPNHSGSTPTTIGELDFEIAKDSTGILINKIIKGKYASTLLARNVLSTVDWINERNIHTPWREICRILQSTLSLSSNVEKPPHFP